MKASVLIFPGAEELDVFGPYEVLRVAQNSGASLETTLATLADPTPIRLAHGTIVLPTEKLAAVDLLVLPGGGWANQAPAGAHAESKNPALLAAIREAHAAGTVLAGVCTGGMLLASAGLLVSRPATTHHSALSDLAGAGTRVTHARVVDDGDIVTCGGVTSGLDLALWLVERFFGAALAIRTAAHLEYDRRGEIHRPPGASAATGA